MPEDKPFPDFKKGKQRKPTPQDEPELRSGVTRRDFLVRGNAGALGIGVVTGAGFAASMTPTRAAPTEAVPALDGPIPLTMRQVTLDIDDEQHNVTVDVRESLWETMNYQLGLSNCNLGCDRAQCGACTILVGGKAVNGCTVLSARLGRGQKIQTVAGLADGPGVQGLHPIQRAFWLEGGFQCGICTRGFVMASYALLQDNNNPTNAEIKQAISGNICRCGEYAKILTSVQKAAAEMRGEAVTYNAPAIVYEEPTVAEGPVENAVTKEFQFENPMSTIEVFDEVSLEVSQLPGIVSVSGSERTITVTWDPARIDEARVREFLEDAGHPVRP